MPRARPTKFATVIGALSSKSSHSSVPSSVLISATSEPLPVTPLVASASVKTPFNGSSGLTGTVATGFGSLGEGGGVGAGGGVGVGVGVGVGAGVAAVV